MLKKCVITLAVSSVLICIIPSPNTIRAMIIAQQITPKNIEAIGDFTDKAADKIIKKIVKAVKEMESK
ncbi:MAG: hypothetical protein SPI35_07985 [Porphyromonas sp.]|nr:hypothetical protein [Porphyromonas sp.]